MPRRTPTAKPAPALIGGPYAAPVCRPGDTLRCKIRGRVVVTGLTRAPIRWPFVEVSGGKRSLIVCGDMVEAIRRESSQAVAWHWGVSRWPVTRWRRKLGVERFNAGTTALYSRLWGVRLGIEGARKGGRATKGIRRGVRGGQA